MFHYGKHSIQVNKSKRDSVGPFECGLMSLQAKDFISAVLSSEKISFFCNVMHIRSFTQVIIKADMHFYSFTVSKRRFFFN